MVSVRRDGWRLGPEPGEDPDVWLNRFNAEWVTSSRRLSPSVLVSLLEVAGGEFIDIVSTLDLEEMGGPVGWATGTSSAPVWLDVGRGYMERVVHQQQIREAASCPLLGAEFTGPALATAVHALPIAFSRMRRPPGTVVAFIAEGDGGGTWFVVRIDNGWELHEEPPAEPSTIVRTSVDGALKLLVRDPAAPQPAITGDGQLGAAVARAKAVLG